MHLGCRGLRAGKIPLTRVVGLAGSRATPVQCLAGSPTTAQVQKCRSPVLSHLLWIDPGRQMAMMWQRTLHARRKCNGWV